uniref:Lys-63-specific deubiquitinase BRCC36 n=1 Tax=Phallusia mammillata TaxID=59560 RepID=A0A6F9D710_9ASCI|nr:lys-63-specific deubiquitinase BRCC36 [Phallusia mammillata]
MGSVAFVRLNCDAYLTCLMHALSNETEEVMGLCIGEMIEKISGCEINISAVLLLRRMDKRKDRVEISVEQLSNASSYAEELAIKSGKNLRIVGWYHSHPHITVWPSHVDVQTQAMYQMMDETFVGLIFSCFNENKANLHQTVEMICFQSLTSMDDSSQYQRLEVPMYLERTQCLSEANLQTLTSLPKTLMHEECEAYDAVIKSCGNCILTKLHNASVHTQSVCNITETVISPLLQILEQTHTNHKLKIKEVEAENEELRKMLAELEASSITENKAS